jgi:hypothetical protein
MCAKLITTKRKTVQINHRLMRFILERIHMNGVGMLKVQGEPFFIICSCNSFDLLYHVNIYIF